MANVLGLKEIKKILPQRSPMLMLDRAQQIDETRWVAFKNASMDEAFFQGHFPGHPIMPGVLQLEAMKQLSELAVRGKLDPAGGADVYMKAASKVKFRRPANPGDRLKISAEIQEIGADSALVKTSIATASGVASEAVISLAVRPLDAAPAALPCDFNEFDKTDAVLMDISRVVELMPHRFPFLLIDYVASMEGERVIAVKNITANEPIFAGDSKLAVLPESILCEIAAQSGCACVLARPENAGKIGYFMAIENAESLAPVHPGDQLVIDLNLPPAKSRFGRGGCEMRVDGKPVFKINLMFAIVDA